MRDLEYLRRLHLQSHARSDEGHWRMNGDSLQPISGVRVAVACYPQMFVQSIGWLWLHVLLAWSVGALAASSSSREGEKVIGMKAGDSIVNKKCREPAERKRVVAHGSRPG
jgi:hypothetical protein